MKNLLLGTALSVATAFTALPAFAEPGGPGAPHGEGNRADQVERGNPGRPGNQGRGFRHGHRDPERRLERMAEELELSERQVEQLRAIFREGREAHERLERGPEHREAHQAIRERTRERAEAVLTPAQRARFEELRAERRARFEERGGRGHRHGHGHGRGHGDCPRGDAG